MATTSEAIKLNQTEPIGQGDIFQDIQYTMLLNETNEYVDVKEFTYPLAIVVSQGCDMYWMDNLISNKKGKSCKVMPMVLMCPFFHTETVRNGDFISSVLEHEKIKMERADSIMYVTDDRKTASQDFHYRFHDFNVCLNNKKVIENFVIDFKQCFTVPFEYLVTHRSQRLFSLKSQYAEQITLKFCSFLSRVGFD